MLVNHLEKFQNTYAQVGVGTHDAGAVEVEVMVVLVLVVEVGRVVFDAYFKTKRMVQLVKFTSQNSSSSHYDAGLRSKKLTTQNVCPAGKPTVQSVSEFQKLNCDNEILFLAATVAQVSPFTDVASLVQAG